MLIVRYTFEEIRSFLFYLFHYISDDFYVYPRTR